MTPKKVPSDVTPSSEMYPDTDPTPITAGTTAPSRGSGDPPRYVRPVPTRKGRRKVSPGKRLIDPTEEQHSYTGEDVTATSCCTLRRQEGEERRRVDRGRGHRVFVAVEEGNPTGGGRTDDPRPIHEVGRLATVFYALNSKGYPAGDEIPVEVCVSTRDSNSPVPYSYPRERPVCSGKRRPSGQLSWGYVHLLSVLTIEVSAVTRICVKDKNPVQSGCRSPLLTPFSGGVVGPRGRVGDPPGRVPIPRRDFTNQVLNGEPYSDSRAKRRVDLDTGPLLEKRDKIVEDVTVS